MTARRLRCNDEEFRDILGTVAGFGSGLQGSWPDPRADPCSRPRQRDASMLPVAVPSAAEPLEGSSLRTPDSVLTRGIDASILPVAVPTPVATQSGTILATSTATPGPTPTATPEGAPVAVTLVPTSAVTPTPTLAPTPTPGRALSVLPVATPVPAPTATPRFTVLTTLTPTSQATPELTPTVIGATPTTAFGTSPTSTPDSAAQETPTPIPTEIGATPTASSPDGPTGTPAPTATPMTPTPTFTPAPTPTPKPTPAGPVQPEWTLKLQIDISAGAGNGPGSGNDLYVGVKAICPEAFGCRAISDLPILSVLDVLQVYLCHPPDDELSCAGVPHLSQSWLDLALVQEWVVDIVYPGPLEDITFSWDASALPKDELDLRLLDSDGRIDMISTTPHYIPKDKVFRICSKLEEAEFKKPCS